MPVIKLLTVHAAAATTPNIYDGLRFDTLLGPALISIWAACEDEGDTFSFSVGEQDYAVDLTPNVEAGTGVVDTDRDQLLFREPINVPGKLFGRYVSAAASVLNSLTVIENVG